MKKAKAKASQHYNWESEAMPFCDIGFTAEQRKRIDVGKRLDLVCLKQQQFRAFMEGDKELFYTLDEKLYKFEQKYGL